MCGRVPEHRKAHGGRRIKRKVLVGEDKGKGDKKAKARGKIDKEGNARHVHNLLITTCEIRCVTESANTGENTTSTYHSNVVPDQDQ